ncbi:MAG: AAA family ATPase [Puniceicoccales bacterium]|jgi:hypothetical protein|nr:AAA family ATPase [Puniceicoccales bacterium]
MKDDINIKNQKNMQEYSDHYLVTGEDKPIDGENNMERIGEIQDHPLYHLVDDRNKIESGEKIDNSPQENFFDKINTYNSPFLQMDIPHRKQILSHWFRAGSLGYIFGMRGSGKTWFAWKMAICISKGEDFGPWKCERPWRTLYVDGEMPLESMQERLKLLDPSPDKDLIFISHEIAAMQESIFLNLGNKDQQDMLLDYCLRKNVKVVFLDNLSCLFYGMRENEADDWERVSPWLLKFRQNGIAVVILHHANREGTAMRGTSRREDAAFWVIKISKNHNGNDKRKGAFFTTSFEKNREDAGGTERNLDWSFVTENGRTQVTYAPTDMRAKIYDLIRDGIESCSDLAEEVGITKGMVSRYATDLSQKGLIKKQGNLYIPA